MTCHCGNARGPTAKDLYCSRACRLTAPCPTGGEFICGKCQLTLPSSEFHWYRDARYLAGWRRFSSCDKCANERSRSYHAEHKEEARVQHSVWRMVNLAAEDERSLRFWFSRQMSGYRKTSRKKGVPFNLAVDDLAVQYQLQNGQCYYTGVRLCWTQRLGKVAPDSMSLDRLVPSLGYTIGNVVLCSFKVNTMKGSFSESDFYSECQRILTMRDERESHETTLDN